MNVKDKTIVVTGAGSGLGRELCLQLLEKGANVAGIDINQHALEEIHHLAAVDDGRFKPFVLDITDNPKVELIAREVEDHFSCIDGVVNNAGIIQKFVSVNDLEIEQICKVIDVNLLGTVYVTKAFLPLLLKRPEARIVNISSMGGFIAFPKQTLYGATKAAVKLFSEGLYLELKETPVRVTVVHPGAIITDIMKNSGLTQPKIDGNAFGIKIWLSAKKAAKIVIKAMEKKEKFRVNVGMDAALLNFSIV